MSLENIISDISELEKGMESTKREYEARKDRDPPVILKDFLNNSEDKLRKLNSDAKNARVGFKISPVLFLFVCFLSVFQDFETVLVLGIYRLVAGLPAVIQLHCSNILLVLSTFALLPRL